MSSYDPLDEKPKRKPEIPGQLDLFAGRSAATSGEQRAYEASDNVWKAAALAAVREVCRSKAEWTVDDVWDTGLERPPEGRAIAGVLRRASGLGWCEKTGRFRASAQVQCHANPRAVWRSLLETSA